MVSTPSDLIKFEKQATGENASTWGTKANVAMSRLEEAIADITNISVTTANYTLDDTQYDEHNDGSNTSESHVAAIKATGTLTGNRQVIVPLRNKIYWIWNATAGAFTLTVIGATGTGIAVPQGTLMAVICDGTNVEALTQPALSNGSLPPKQGADVASASALPVLLDGDYFDVTGTTTVTSINSIGDVGTEIKLHFDAVLTLTHHATNLILPGGANILTAAGDECTFIEYGSGTYRMTNYTRASSFGAYLSEDQTWTGSQRSTPITDNDGSFDMDAGQDFLWTPSAADVLEFTNEASGQRGLIRLVNPSAYAITFGAEVEADGSAAANLSIAGTYLISYWCYDGSNVSISYSGDIS